MDKEHGLRLVPSDFSLQNLPNLPLHWLLAKFMERPMFDLSQIKYQVQAIGHYYASL
jgi:hypothetical protein